MIKSIAMIGMAAATIFLWAGHADAGDPPTINREYIEEHYPEVYLQIYREGKEAGGKEAEAPSKDVTVPARVAPAAVESVVRAVAPAAVQQAKPDLGAWWEKSSLSYSPLPERWLFHIEGSFDYKRKSGNTDSDLYNASTSLMVRKQRFTNTLSYMIDKELVEPTQSSPNNNRNTDYRTIQESLRYDLTARFYADVGYMWEKDTVNMITDRNIFYAGLGHTLLDRQRHHLDIFLAGGYQEEKYPNLVQVMLGTGREKVTAGYVKQTYRWKITDSLTYNETFRIIYNFESSKVFNDDLSDLHVIGRTNRYRWFLINEILVKLTSYLNFVIGYKIEYDSDPWPTVLDRDETFKSGLQFSY